MRVQKRARPSAFAAVSLADAGAVVQIKVWLQGVTPMVWRRVLVPSDCTLRELHGVIQVAMGWEGTHLYQFRLRAARYGSPELAASSPEVTLAELWPREGARFAYEYDLNVPWRHEVRVERRSGVKAGKSHPACVGGAGDCPPEDCGGPGPFMAARNAALSPGVLEDLDTMTEIFGRIMRGRHADPLGDADARRLEDAVGRCEAHGRLQGRAFSRRAVNARLRDGGHLDLMYQQC